MHKKCMMILACCCTIFFLSHAADCPTTKDSETSKLMQQALSDSCYFSLPPRLAITDTSSSSGSVKEVITPSTITPSYQQSGPSSFLGSLYADVREKATPDAALEEQLNADLLSKRPLIEQITLFEKAYANLLGEQKLALDIDTLERRLSRLHKIITYSDGYLPQIYVENNPTKINRLMDTIANYHRRLMMAAALLEEAHGVISNVIPEPMDWPLVRSSNSETDKAAK